MNKYVILELEDGNKCAAIDTLKIKDKEYFLVVLLSKDAVIIDKELKVCRYNELKNYFEKIDNKEEYDFIMSIFNKRLDEQKEFEDKLNDLIELKIIDIDGYNYTLKKPSGETILKNIEFYIDIKPQINDIIYMSKNIINEVNIFYYGVINDLNKVSTDEIIKLIHNDGEYYLQRYYG